MIGLSFSVPITDCLTSLAMVGGYINPIKAAGLLILCLPWLWFMGWVDKDVRTARMPKSIWVSALVVSGLIGLVAWLFVPMYLMGMCVFIVLTATAAGVYISQRNARVVPDARILTGDWFGQMMQSRQNKSVKLDTKLKFYDHNSQPVVLPTAGDVEEKQTFNNAQNLLYDVLWRRASEVHLSARADHMSIKYVIDGVVVKTDPLSSEEGLAVVDYIKEVAGMDVEDRRRPQEGKMAVDMVGQQVDVEVASSGGKTGPRMQMKIVQEAVKTRIDELGLFPDMLERIKAVTQEKAGLVLVAAPSQNGLTSTLYSMLRMYDAYILQLATAEHKPDVDLENVTQNTYKDDADQAKVVAGIFRRDPDVVMVDKCGDAETANIVAGMGTEKCILQAIKATDSFTALAKWVKTVGDTKKAVAPLRAVVSQVLLRKLCPNCREAYQPNLDMLRKANLPADGVEKFYRTPTKPLTDEKGRPMECPTCQGSGYFGRTAAFEFLEINSELRKLIASGANLTQIKAAARKNKMLYLQEEALRLVMEGVTSVQEVIRVTKSQKENR